MLAQLDKVDGVKAASTNRSGGLVRISFEDETDPETVASAVDAIFKKQNRKAKQLDGDALASAIKNEEWRTKSQVGELSEIEFRTVFARRVKQFSESNGLDGKTASRLIEISEEVLAETPKSDENTKWGKFCGDMAGLMLKKSAELLTEEQLQALAKKLRARIPG